MGRRPRSSFVASTRARRAWVARLEPLEERTLLSIYTVNTTKDENDANAIPGDLSLREAIIKANANPGPDTIILPAGIYKLTIPGAGDAAGQTGDRTLTQHRSILRAGSASP